MHKVAAICDACRNLAALHRPVATAAQHVLDRSQSGADGIPLGGRPRRAFARMDFKMESCNEKRR